ncbi:MAG: EAP30/Vps36 family vacuolar-sorting protein, partial [archaeon]|nr:EAP30/Vps36 family vacuolar-sorting protein [archaeon]
MQQIMNTAYVLPKHVYLKFDDKKADYNKSYEMLKMAINAKEYNISHKPTPSESQESKNNQGEGNTENDTPYNKADASMGFGAERVKNIMMRRVEQQNQMTKSSFADIDALRKNAKEMIDLAQQIRAKVNLNNDKSLSSEIANVLGKIGFVDPITKEVAGSDYYLNLAQQINMYFTEYFQRNSDVKVLTLIDAYCIYNRARGGNTISPKDMMQALNNFNNIHTNIMIKEFNKELTVIHTNQFSNENILYMVKEYMQKNNVGYITNSDLAIIINAKNVLLEKILIEDLLVNGFLLLDEAELDTKYYLNWIIKYN